MYLGTLLFGLFFLITPEVSTFDIIPDFIGCLLIMRAISNLAIISGEAEEAKKGFAKLLAVSAVKSVLFFPLVTVARTDGAIYLAFTVAFAVLSLMYTLPAFRELYTAIGIQCDNIGEKIKGTRRIYSLTSIFFIIKAALSVFPEIVYIPIMKEDISGGAYYPNGFMKTGVSAIAVVLTLIIGIIWYLIACGYFKRVCKNKALSSYIRMKAAESPVPPEKLITSSISSSFFLLRISFFCSVSVILDGVNIIPDFVPPVLVLFALTRLKKAGIGNLATKITAWISYILGVVSYLSVSLFAGKYDALGNANFALVKSKFTLPAILQLIYNISFAISLIFLFILIRRIVKEHTGNIWESAFGTHNKEEIRRKRRHISLSYIISVLHVLSSLSNGVAYLFHYTSDIYGVLNTLFGFIVAVIANEYLHSVHTSCNEHYLNKPKRA